MEKSLFMMDKSRTDNKESVIDYMLSWTLRMSSRSGECKNSSVQNYCERILSKLLFNDFDKIRELFGFEKLEGEIVVDEKVDEGIKELIDDDKNS